MDNTEIKTHIDAIIEKTFEVLKAVYKNQKKKKNKEQKTEHLFHVGSRIIFPKYSEKYRNGETRLSEQELRFIFVEQFNDYCNNHQEMHWFYSVETPTEEKYQFSESGAKLEQPKKVDAGDKNGQSAMVDLAIHDEQLNRIALIEFKALNPEASCFKKDFIKLSEEPTTLTYFIMYVRTHDAGTLNSLKLKVDSIGEKTKYCCYDLESGKRIESEIRTNQ